VKSLTQEASIGISRASVVEDEEKLAERVRFITTASHDANVERFIEGASCTWGSSATSG